MTRFYWPTTDTNGNRVIIRRCPKCGEKVIELIEGVEYTSPIEVLFKGFSGEVIVTKKIRARRSWCNNCNREYKRDRYQNDPEIRERINKRSRDRYQNDPEIRERINERQRDYKIEIKIKAMEKLGGVFCVGLEGKRCKFNSGPPSYVIDVDVLQVDHIHDDGGEDREKGLFGTALYRHIVNDLSVEEANGKYQVLCANCNRKKERERRRRKSGKTKDVDRTPSDIERFELLVESVDEDEISVLLNYMNQIELAYSRVQT